MARGQYKDNDNIYDNNASDKDNRQSQIAKVHFRQIGQTASLFVFQITCFNQTRRLLLT